MVAKASNTAFSTTLQAPLGATRAWPTPKASVSEPRGMGKRKNEDEPRRGGAKKILCRTCGACLIIPCTQGSRPKLGFFRRSRGWYARVSAAVPAKPGAEHDFFLLCRSSAARFV